MAAYSRIRVCGKRFNKTLRRIRDEGTAPSTKELGYVREFRGSEWSLMDMCAAKTTFHHRSAYRGRRESKYRNAQRRDHAVFVRVGANTRECDDRPQSGGRW